MIKETKGSASPKQKPAIGHEPGPAYPRNSLLSNPY